MPINGIELRSHQLSPSIIQLLVSICKIPVDGGPTCSVSCSVLVSLEIRGFLLFPGSASQLFLAGGSLSTSDSSSSLDPFESPSSLPSSGSSSTECDAMQVAQASGTGVH